MSNSTSPRRSRVAIAVYVSLIAIGLGGFATSEWARDRSSEGKETHFRGSDRDHANLALLVFEQAWDRTPLVTALAKELPEAHRLRRAQRELVGMLEGELKRVGVARPALNGKGRVEVSAFAGGAPGSFDFGQASKRRLLRDTCHETGRAAASFHHAKYRALRNYGTSATVLAILALPLFWFVRVATRRRREGPTAGASTLSTP